MNPERKNNTHEFKTIQDGGLIKKHHEVNNVERKQYTNIRKRDRSELHSSSGMSDFLLVHLLLFLNGKIRPLLCIIDKCT